MTDPGFPALLIILSLWLATGTAGGLSVVLGFMMGTRTNRRQLAAELNDSESTGSSDSSKISSGGKHHGK